MLTMLARAARQKHSITGVELLCMLWVHRPADGRQRLKGSPADADDARPCRSPKAFNHWRRTAMHALAHRPADGRQRLKGSPADADDAGPCRTHFGSSAFWAHWAVVGILGLPPWVISTMRG